MIKSLAIVSLLSCGVGSQATPHFNNEQINETKHVEQRRLYENSTSTSQQDADLTWQISQSNFTQTQNIDTTSTVNDSIYMDINKKWEKQTQTNVASMKTYMYANNTFLRKTDENNNNLTGWFISLEDIYTNSIQHNNTLLYQIVFAPYNTLKTSYIDLSFTIESSTSLVRTQTANNNDVYYAGLRYNIKYLISTDENWAQYYDYTMTQNANSNYDKIQAMTLASNGFTYQQIEKTQDITIGETLGNQLNTSAIENRTTITQQIPISNTKINYISIYLEPKVYLAYQTETNILTREQAINQGVYFNDGNGQQSNGYRIMIRDEYNEIESTPNDLNTDAVKQSWSIDHYNVLTAYGTWVPNISTEVIDVPGIMFQVLGMPWTFISTAFNLTLFPGTPYSFNVGSVLLMVLGVLIFVFLIKLIIFKK